jgi:SOS response regulatory protein OraA/RecX
MTEITGLHEDGDVVRVELDGRPWRAIPASAAARAGLCIGKQLGRPELRLLRRELRRAEALHTAAAALRRRPYSRSGLERRLERRGVAPAAREAALTTLESAGYVDDESYARARALGLAGRGYGDPAIRLTLDREGVPREACDVALAELPPELERAERELRRSATPEGALGRLARRGFSSETIEELASRLRWCDPS